MNKYTILSFQISLILISGIISSYPENYTMPYLFSVRIGRQSTEISLLLNSFSSNNILFTNSNRKYSKEISSKRKMDVFMDKLEFNAHIIPDFPFSLILDNTELNSPGIQGEFGLGIDKENRNDLIENLFSNQVISKRKLILETSNDLKPKIYTNTESVANNFKYCNLTRKSDLDNLYEEAWVCELSHLIKEEENLENKTLWENAKLIMARAVFDTRQRNIILPIKYLDNFKDYWNLEKCEEVYNQSLNEKYFKCDKSSFDKKPIYFVIDGYGLKFTFDDLFIIDGKFKRSIISFTNTISNSNLFIFGMPLFKKYNIMFDFENKRVGFKGENIIDFNKDYSKWKEEKSIIKINESNVISVSWTNERTILIIGTTVGILIILYILFYVIRSFKRNNMNKTHSKFVEQVKDY
jgi:hypothetical protein